MIDSQRLAYFAVVARTSSIRRSAELLHITPAALSRAVKVLEGEVGVQLVAQRGRGIELTDAGRELAARSAPILDDLAALHDIGTPAPEAAPVLRYASHETFGTYFASELVAVAPRGASIEHHFMTPGTIERAVADRLVDAGIAYAAHPHPGTVALHAGSIAMGLYGRPALRGVPFEDLVHALPVAPPSGADGGATLDGWPAPHIPRTARYRVTHTETALEHCRMGRCAAYFADFVVELHNRRAAANRRLVRLDVPADVADHHRDVYVVVRSGESGSPTPTALVAAVERLPSARGGAQLD